MKKHTTIILILALITSISCKNDSKFSEAKNLSELEKTEFIPTLEHKISADKNAVYCATLLFAWDEIRKQLNAPLTISKENADLAMLNQSTSFENVLMSDEYTVSGEVEGDIIKAKAEFSKSLPFEFKLQSFVNKLDFDGTKVFSFGVDGYDSYGQLNLVKIVYYKNDNNFVIKLLPKDKAHEIILFMSEERFRTIAEMTTEIEKLAEIGSAERKNESINWKYYYNDEDVVIIPKFNFNIETNYNTIEGNRFIANTQVVQVEKAWQRTAFVLDEKGAEIESEAETEEVIEELGLETPKPKKMVFDKPFLILMKRTDSKNPYFGLWVANAELMVKE
jgi:hypothetical protein